MPLRQQATTPSSEPVRLAGIGDEAAPDIAGQVAAVRRLGWTALELRTVDGIPVAALDAQRVRSIRGELDRAGIHVVCLDSRIGGWARPVSTGFATDLAELDTLIGHGAILGVRAIRIMSYPNDGLPETRWRATVVDRVRRLTDRAAGAGFVLLHESCSGWAGQSAERALDLLAAVGNPALRLLFDTGNGVAHGYDGLSMLAELVPHVAHVHVKDGVATPEGPRFTLPGDGDARVADCLRLLLDHGYRGAVSLEPHLAVAPHAGRVVAGADGVARFVEAGRRLDALVHEPARRAVAG
ncbi:sugar phosphate isomerase/epimerase family protein [Amycolatopsis thermalba]|uniref:sugar phosphate isomerase/epimerase family protein n=1 Tax=Amycolatopsis thermalba TaxID=944492 RepID=UPI0019671E43|nr:sugar phosphate isomerase/epimerase family protein [Amycolatopsis thermalba]